MYKYVMILYDRKKEWTKSLLSSLSLSRIMAPECFDLHYFSIFQNFCWGLETTRHTISLVFFSSFALATSPGAITGITGESAIHCNYKIMCNSHSVFLSFTTVCEVFVTQ